MPIIPIVILILLVSVWAAFAIAHNRADDLDIPKPRKKMVYNPDTGVFTTQTVKKPNIFTQKKSTPPVRDAKSTTSRKTAEETGEKPATTVGGMLKKIYIAHVIGYGVCGIAEAMMSYSASNTLFTLLSLGLWMGTLAYVLVCLVRCPQGSSRKPYAVWFALVLTVAPYVMVIVMPCALVGQVIAGGLSG